MKISDIQLSTPRPPAGCKPLGVVLVLTLVDASPDDVAAILRRRDQSVSVKVVTAD